jgi:hypothetical protein
MLSLCFRLPPSPVTLSFKFSEKKKVLLSLRISMNWMHGVYSAALILPDFITQVMFVGGTSHEARQVVILFIILLPSPFYKRIFPSALCCRYTLNPCEIWKFTRLCHGSSCLSSDTVLFGRWLQTYRRNLLPPIFNIPFWLKDLGSGFLRNVCTHLQNCTPSHP